MAKITDPDSLNVGTELVLNTTSKTIQLVATGNLVAKDGVTLQALYSKLILLWETSTYNKYPFPMYVIDAKSGQFQFGTDGGSYNGWKPLDDTTRQMFRDGGWSEYAQAGGSPNRVYVGIVSLGNVNTGAQMYYQRDAADAPANFTFTDEVNEGIQVIGDASNGNFDKHTYFKGFVREYGYKYKDSVLADTGQTQTGAFLVNLLLSNEADLDLVVGADDSTVDNTSPYNLINIKYFSAAFNKDVDTTGAPRDFGIVIDVGTHSGIDGATTGTSTLTTAAAGITGADYTGGKLIVHEGADAGTYNISGTPTASSVTVTGKTFGTTSNLSFTLQRAAPVSATLNQIYTRIQYLLRQNSDIDATGGTVTGKTASLLLNFVGARLDCGFYAPTNPNGGGSGVVIMGLRDADLNNVRFYDNGFVQREYPYASAGTLNFNSFLTDGGTGYYRMYFTSLPGAGDDYGEAGAVTVNDKDGNPIFGNVSSGAISFSFDYSNNEQGGRTKDTNAGVTVVAGNKGKAKPVVATGTIDKSKSVVITLTAEQDRAFSNP